MGIIMIRCPATDRDVSTGIEVSDVDQLPRVRARMRCAACGRVHLWSKDEAWLSDGAEEYRAAAVSA